LSTEAHDIATQKTAMNIFTAVRTSNINMDPNSHTVGTVLVNRVELKYGTKTEQWKEKN
jgi:hypothetical protein